MSPLLAGLRLLTILRKNRFPNLEVDHSEPGEVEPDLGSRFRQLEPGDGPPDVAPPPPDNWVARPAHVDDRPDGSSLGMDSSAPPPDALAAAADRASREGRKIYLGFDPNTNWRYQIKPTPHTTHVVNPDGSYERHKYVNPHIARYHDGSVMKFGHGGYPVFHTTQQGQVLCHECTAKNEEEFPDDPVVAHDANWENPDLYCDGCNTRIESAYAEPREGDAPLCGSCGGSGCDDCDREGVLHND